MAMENKSELEVMKYFTGISSLERTSAIAVVTSLWKHEDICFQSFSTLLGHDKLFYDKVWEKIENRVLRKLSHISVPNSLTKLIQDTIKSIGWEIVTWLRYNYWTFKKPENLFERTNVICWKSNGAIDYEKTGKVLLSLEKTVTDKWNIACTYFFEEEIQLLASEVALKECQHLSEADFAKSFWYYIMGYATPLVVKLQSDNFFERTNYNMHEFMFNWAIQTNREHAARYLWNTFGNHEKVRNLVKAAIVAAKKRRADIMCFLLSQMNKNERDKIFKNNVLDVLCSLLMDWKCCDFFLPTLNYVSSYLSEFHYLYLLQEVVNRIPMDYDRNDKYRILFNELWQQYTQHVQSVSCNVESLAHSFPTHLFGDILKRFSCLKDEVNFIRVLSETTLQQKKSFISSLDGICMCSYLITNKNWNLLNVLLKQTLFLKKDLLFFKFCVLELKGHHICNTFIDENQWAAAEKFLIWCFESKSEKDYFKKNLIKQRYSEKVFNVVRKKETDFSNIEKLLGWCFSNKSEIDSFKKDIILKDVATFSQLVLDSVRRDEWHSVDTFIMWSFADDQMALNSFKRSLLKVLYNDNIYATSSILWNLVIKGNGFKSLERLLRWCVCDEEELMTFKSKLLIINMDKNFNNICALLLFTQNYELANEFVDWCCSSSTAKANKFKEKFLMTNAFYIFQRPGWVKTDLVNLVEWLNPSVETVARLKKKYLGCKLMKEFFDLLDQCFR